MRRAPLSRAVAARFAKKSGQQTPSVNSRKLSTNAASVEGAFKSKMVKELDSRPPSPAMTANDEFSTSSLNDQNEDDPQDDIIRRSLSMRAYHLPGNAWDEDLRMYLSNNHLIFGICCHHRLHPVRAMYRLVILLGSLSFGLCLTNTVWLYYLWGSAADHDATALSISLGGDAVERIADDPPRIDVSHGMAMLWTVGAAAHCVFDLALWHMIACTCVRNRSCRALGRIAAVAVAILLVAPASFVVVVRAYESGEDAGATFGGADFRYLYRYVFEMFLSLFVYTPLVQSLLFVHGWTTLRGNRNVEGRNRNVEGLSKPSARKNASATDAPILSSHN